ncbi:DNA topoisomerase VI subunit B, partial [Haloferax elongans ATCC BAA-1513]
PRAIRDVYKRQEEFTRVGAKTTEKIIDSFRDRHFGREMTWKTPTSHETTELVETVEDAVANKGQEATTAFAEELVDIVTGKDRIAHGELLTIVGNVAESVGDDTGKTFGDTVQENIVEAVWPVLTEDRESDVYAIVDDVTTTQKDDAGKVSMARSIATQFAETTGPTDRATYDDVEDFVSWAAERTKEREDETYGETAREKIADAVWSRMRTVEDDVPKVRDIADDRNIARDLLEAMRETDILAPPTDCLSPITSELVEAGLKKEFDADFYAAATRDAEVHGGDPFIVEAGIAYGGDIKSDGSIDLLRFANRVPLVYQRGACTITHVVKDIGWRNYGLDQPGGSGMPKGPAVLMVHVASTNVPFTSESKDALADVPAIQDEVELAIREAARELKSYLSKRRSLQKRRQKQDVIGRILPQMATKLSEVTGREEPKIDGALARIMNNVSVERTVEDGTVTLTVTNYSSTNESPDITDILDTEPLGLNGEANVVDLDGEWFVKWNPTVAAGESETLTYSVEQDASFDINVDGVETEKLTVNA